jgi:hypothetical protein
MFEKSEQVNELFTALAKAQAEFEPAELDGKNPHFDSRFATLASIFESCRVILAKHGLSVVQPVSMVDGQVTVTTIVGHSSGQWVSGQISMRPERTGPQAIGSTITYFRRYGLGAMLGIVTDSDDDAEGAERGPNRSNHLKSVKQPETTKNFNESLDDWKKKITITPKLPELQKLIPAIETLPEPLKAQVKSFWVEQRKKIQSGATANLMKDREAGEEG